MVHWLPPPCRESEGEAASTGPIGALLSKEDAMNLDEFIRESLLEVLRGIKEAQKITNEQGPVLELLIQNGGKRRITTNTCQRLLLMLQFLRPSRQAVAVKPAYGS